MKKQRTTEEFISDAIEIHGNTYDYSKSEYINKNIKIIITCRLHGNFKQLPYNHLYNKQGCPICGGTAIKTTTRFISDANKIHNNIYLYLNFKYVNDMSKGLITCKLHGDFSQTPRNHLSGHGCPVCAGNKKLSTSDFIIRSKEIHGNIYDYSLTNYTGIDSKLKIICSLHGKFLQTAYHHLNGSQCPSCKSSKGESKIRTFLQVNNIPYIFQYSYDNCIGPLKNKLKYDFYVPSKNMLIEFDGPQHSGNLRLGKHTMTKSQYKKLKLHDNIKNKYAMLNNIKLLRIPYTKINQIKNILEQELYAI